MAGVAYGVIGLGSFLIVADLVTVNMRIDKLPALEQPDEDVVLVATNNNDADYSLLAGHDESVTTAVADLTTTITIVEPKLNSTYGRTRRDVSGKFIIINKFNISKIYRR